MYIVADKVFCYIIGKIIYLWIEMVEMDMRNKEINFFFILNQFWHKIFIITVIIENHDTIVHGEDKTAV